MTDASLTTLFALLGAVGASLMVLGLLILRLTLTRRLKASLSVTDQYWHSGAIDFGLANTALFAWACAIPGIQRLERFRRVYPELDIRALANSFERVTAYGTIGGLMLFFVCIPFFYIFKP